MGLLTAVLASMALYVPVPTDVTIHVGACPYDPEPTSCADVVARAIYLLPAPGDPAYFRFTVAHELGHIWDADHMTDTYRAAFAAQIGMAGQPWFSANDSPTDPGEIFANAYAYCSMSPRLRRAKRRAAGGYPALGIYWASRRGRRIVANTCWLLDHPPITPAA